MIPWLTRIFLLCLLLHPEGLSAESREFTHAQMGTRFRLLLHHDDEKEAAKAAKDVFARIDALNQSLSDYLTDSELTRLSRSSGSGREVKLGDDLLAVLESAQSFSSHSKGAFDVTVGPLMQLWRRSRRSGKLPKQERLAEARLAVGHRFLHLDPANRTARLEKPEMRLDLGGIAKGYALDEAIKVLDRYSIGNALIDGGGDIRVIGHPPDKNAWVVGIPGKNKTKLELVHLARGAIATSGDLFKFALIGDRRFSHIMDPATGLGLEQIKTVSVLAPTGMEADALASTFSVLSIEGAKALRKARFPETSVRILLRKEEAVERIVWGKGFEDHPN